MSHSGVWKSLLLVVAVVAALISVQVLRDANRDSYGDMPTFNYNPDTSTVLYEVEGSVGFADVTYATPDGTERITPTIPLIFDGGPGLTLEFPTGTRVSLTARGPGDGGTVSCRITVEGEVVSEDASTASSRVASCAGTS